MVLNHRSGHLCRHHGRSSSACDYGGTRPAKFVRLDPDVREHAVRDAYARVGRDHNGRLVVEPSCPSKSKCHRAVPTVKGWRVKASASSMNCLRVVDPSDGSGPQPAGISEVPSRSAQTRSRASRKRVQHAATRTVIDRNAIAVWHRGAFDDCNCAGTVRTRLGGSRLQPLQSGLRKSAPDGARSRQAARRAQRSTAYAPDPNSTTGSNPP